MTFSAILLAGGKSSRMGSDKASLAYGNQSLWQHQIASILPLSPSELFISGPKSGPYQFAGYPILEDPQPNLGPLSGLIEGLRHSQSPWLLVLGIDLPNIPTPLLSDLLKAAGSANSGIVPKDDSWWQPLAAVYPKTILPLAESCLANSDRSLQNLVRLGIEQGLLASRQITPQEQPLFRNINTPSDLKY